MERIINTKTEQRSIYEIYRACRLCGAGAGYKMPIIQSVVDIETSGIELSQKIRDCVQIEVHSEDKMPPLICELCVDKVDDFYEFMQMCQRTNKQTRTRLGLPMQTPTRTLNSDSSSTSGDCILGVTEPVYQNDDSDEPLAPVTRKSKQTGSKNIIVKKENSSKQKRPPTPPRATRQTKSSSEDTMSLSSLKQQQTKKPSKAPPVAQPKSILKTALKKDKEKREESPVPAKAKRPRELSQPEVPPKRVKLAAPTPPPSRKPGPRSRRPPSPVPPPAPPPGHPCRICGKMNTTTQSLGNHLRTHTVHFTSPKLACNACRLWFGSADEATEHHRAHRARRRAYRCVRCRGRHDTYASYTGHIENGECVPWEEVPDKQCAECWRMFPTDYLLSQHPCGGEDARPGGKCGSCKRTYALLKNLKKHEATCTQKKKSSIKVDPSVAARITPAQIRVVRCDALLTARTDGHYDVSGVKPNFGLDRSCIYPYSLPCVVKSELPEDSMVKIQPEVVDEIDDHVHWDSDTDSDGEARKTVQSLSTLAMKKIFSNKCLGKVPRKRRKLKMEKNAFDSLLNASYFETTLNRDINNIIDNLGNDDTWNSDAFNDKIVEDNQNGSDEESLLTNYVLFDDPMASNNDKSNVVDGADNEKTDVENSNDSQSILDSNTKVSDESERNSNFVLSSSDKNLDKIITASGIETGAVDESEKENTKEISRVSGDENKSSKNNESNVESADTRNEDCTTTETHVKVNNETEDSINDSDNNRIDIKHLTTENESNINIDSKQESTNNDNCNKNVEDNIKMDCTDNIISNSSENANNCVASDIGAVNIHKENNTIENRNINLNNENDSEKTIDDLNYYSKITSSDTENTNNDAEIKNIDAEIKNHDAEIKNHDAEIKNNDAEIKNNDAEIESNVAEINNDDTEITNNYEEITANDPKNIDNDKESTNNDKRSIHNCNESNDSTSEKINGQVEEKSDKLSFGDMNDISDTEVDDKKLMDALNEHIGENDRTGVDFDEESFNQNNESEVIYDKNSHTQNNDDEHVSDEQNGAKNKSSEACDDITNINHETHLNDHEKAINDFLSENNFASTEDTDEVAANESRGIGEADKISLEDLLPSKSDAKSMDLDSISDDDFDFDAC